MCGVGSSWQPSLKAKSDGDLGLESKPKWLQHIRASKSIWLESGDNRFCVFAYHTTLFRGYIFIFAYLAALWTPQFSIFAYLTAFLIPRKCISNTSNLQFLRETIFKNRFCHELFLVCFRTNTRKNLLKNNNTFGKDKKKYYMININAIRNKVRSHSMRVAIFFIMDLAGRGCEKKGSR